MNPAADLALVALALVVAILVLAGRIIPRLRFTKMGAPNCSGPCGCARQTAPLSRISANSQADGNPKSSETNGAEA